MRMFGCWVRLLLESVWMLLELIWVLWERDPAGGDRAVLLCRHKIGDTPPQGAAILY